LAFGVAAATQAAFAVILLLLRIRGSGHVPAQDSRIRAGFRHLRTDPAIVAILLGSAAVGIGADPVITLTPSIAENLGAGPTLVGALASAFGVGAGAAFVVLGRLRGRFGGPRLATAGLLLMAAGLAGLAGSPAPVPALASMAVAGSGMTLSLTGFTTLLQQRSPEHLRGRLMALWSVAFLGSRPLAAGFNGAVADLVSTAVALALAVAILLIVAWLARPSRTDP
jgi:MFS family permease